MVRAPIEILEGKVHLMLLGGLFEDALTLRNDFGAPTPSPAITAIVKVLIGS